MMSELAAKMRRDRKQARAKKGFDFCFVVVLFLLCFGVLFLFCVCGLFRCSSRLLCSVFRLGVPSRLCFVSVFFLGCCVFLGVVLKPGCRRGRGGGGDERRRDDGAAGGGGGPGVREKAQARHQGRLGRGMMLLRCDWKRLNEVENEMVHSISFADLKMSIRERGSFDQRTRFIFC